MWKRIAFYVNKYPTRVSGYISAMILNVSHIWQNFPIGLFVPAAMLLIMFGEGAQRTEDKKTLKALYTENDLTKSDEEILSGMIKDLYSKGENK